MANRQTLLNGWLSSLWPDYVSHNLAKLTGDASQRDYFRLTYQKQTFIVMDTTPDQSMVRFVQLNRTLADHHLNVPELFHIDMKNGFIVMTDFGNQHYLDQLTIQNATHLYENALQSLIKMQKINLNNLSLPTMGMEYIEEQIEIFKRWYLQEHLKMPLSSINATLFNELKKVFWGNFKNSPQVFVHLDFHSRNLMKTATNAPGILDYQDAMLGPVGYDIVSLFQDAYLTWPEDAILKWTKLYLKLSTENNIIGDIALKDFTKHFKIIGVHRHLKNIGVFSRLRYRDGKNNYFKHINTLLNYTLESCKIYPELDNLRKLFIETILPRSKEIEKLEQPVA